MEDLEHIYSDVFEGCFVFKLLDEERDVLATVVGFECSDNTLIQRLDNGRYVRREEEDQDVGILITLEATFKCSWFYPADWHVMH